MKMNRGICQLHFLNVWGVWLVMMVNWTTNWSSNVDAILIWPTEKLRMWNVILSDKMPLLFTCDGDTSQKLKRLVLKPQLCVFSHGNEYDFITGPFSVLKSFSFWGNWEACWFKLQIKFWSHTVEHLCGWQKVIRSQRKSNVFSPIKTL